MQVVLAIMVMGSMHSHLVDVNGTCLLGEIKMEEKIFMEILHGFKKYYPPGVLLVLKQTLYGVKDAAKAFWKLLLGIMNELGYMQNKENLCLYYKRDPTIELIVWLSFIDNMLIICKEEGMAMVKKHFTDMVDCDDIGPMKEYIGMKINVDHATKNLKITQPVLVKSLIDEFTFDEPNAKPVVSATGGNQLMYKGPNSLCGSSDKVPQWCW